MRDDSKLKLLSIVHKCLYVIPRPVLMMFTIGRVLKESVMDFFATGFRARRE